MVTLLTFLLCTAAGILGTFPSVKVFHASLPGAPRMLHVFAASLFMVFLWTPLGDFIQQRGYSLTETLGLLALAASVSSFSWAIVLDLIDERAV